ncbi:RIP metalloprotease RseP [candidate division KSB1 bacterium]|nr:RIP metalloprotease RseP [candidate division KSB1 bacterium]
MSLRDYLLIYDIFVVTGEEIMITILAFIFVLGVLVFIHEFGHFIMAKIVGIRVERFSLGFPPRMFGKKIGETDYCISWVPIGGYVKLSGMIDESMEKNSVKGEPWEFMSKPVYQRFLVIFAGPMMNILLALFIFSMSTYLTGLNEPLGTTVGTVKQGSFVEQAGFQKGDQIVSVNDKPVETWMQVEELSEGNDQVNVTWKRNGETFSGSFSPVVFDSVQQSLPPVVGDVINDYPASKVGIEKGDLIVSVKGQPINTWNDLTDVIHDIPDQQVTIQWERNGEILSSEITPVPEPTDGTGRIGISFLTVSRDVGLFYSFYMGTQYSINLTRLVYRSLKSVISGRESFKNAFGGPIVIAKMAGESARSGAGNLFIFMAFLSLNLGFLNLLPIPVLDGGHLVFIFIEAIIRRPVPDKTKIVVQQIGMALLLAFMVFVIINDIRRIW